MSKKNIYKLTYKKMFVFIKKIFYMDPYFFEV